MPSNKSRSGFSGHVLYYDSETRPSPVNGRPKEEIHHFRLACSIHCEYKDSVDIGYSQTVQYNREDVANLVDQLACDCRKLTFIAHNVSFDMTATGLWDSLTDLGWKLTYALAEDPPTVLRWEKHSRKIVCIDTLNFFRMSLAKLGDSLGYQKLLLPDFADDDETWVRYCRRDVDILREAMGRYFLFLRDNDLGPFRFTAASQAYHYWNYLPQRMRVVEHANETAHDMERAAYFGGRTSTFYLGAVHNSAMLNGDVSSGLFTNMLDREYGPLTIVDVNSLYPFVMGSKLYPAQIHRIKDEPTVAEIRKLADAYSIVATVMISSETDTYPVRVDNRVAWCRGQFWTHLTGDLLLDAINKDHVGKIGQCVLYHRNDIFSQFVDKLWSIRRRYQEENDSSFELLSKLMLNSLSGKFGERGTMWSVQSSIPIEMDWGQWVHWDNEEQVIHKFRAINALVQEEIYDRFSPRTFVAIAAAITSNGEYYMRYLRHLAGDKNVFYQGVDSLHVNDAGLANLRNAEFIHPTQIGKLKIADTARYATYRGIRNYSFGDKQVISGIPKTARLIADSQWEYQHFCGLKEVISGGSRNNVMVRTLTRTLRGEYEIGNEKKSGWIEPLYLCPDRHG